MKNQTSPLVAMNHEQWQIRFFFFTIFYIYVCFFFCYGWNLDRRGMSSNFGGIGGGFGAGDKVEFGGFVPDDRKHRESRGCKVRRTH